MKTIKNVCMIIFLLFFVKVEAQIGDGSIPYSFEKERKVNLDKIPYFVVAELDNKKLLEKDEKYHLENSDQPYTFAAPITVDMDIEKNMVWEKMGDSLLVGRLMLSSPNAFSSFLIFDKFYLPDHVRLYAYNKDGSQIIGAFTSTNNKEYGRFSLGPIIGENIILELIKPQKLESLPVLHLKSYIHDYKNVFDYIVVDENGRATFGQSNWCNINVKCPEGDKWCNQIRSVALIVSLGTNDLTAICTGSLINNERYDGRPYFLTANHCLRNHNVNDWMFIFNYQSHNCDNQPITIPSTSHSISGAALKSRWCVTDFMLLELTTRPPRQYNVFYSGWDREDEKSKEGASISHPMGDIKKIATYNKKIGKSAFSSTVPCEDFIQAWHVTLNKGTMENVSSGASLYNEEGRLIGQLVSTYGTVNCPKDAYYGMLHYSWADGSSSSSRLKDWLNPNATSSASILSMSGCDPCKSSYSFTNANDLHTSVNVVGQFPYNGLLPGTRTYNGVYTASGTIEAGNNVIIQPGTDKSVEFYAETILLKPGFHAKAGSHFIASAQPCEITCSSGLMKSGNYLDSEPIVILEETALLSNDTLLSDSKQVKSYTGDNNEDIEILENLDKDISIYPNPNTGSFTIKTNNFDNINQIQVINPLGQIIYNIENPIDNNIILPSGAKGTFFVRIITATESITKKILVE